MLQQGCNVTTTRSGKNTHISRISNSVTHLRSYTNTAIADIQPISPWRAPISARQVPIPVWNSSSRNTVTGQSSQEGVQHWIIPGSIHLVVHGVFQQLRRSTSVMSRPLSRHSYCDITVATWGHRPVAAIQVVHC